MIKVVAKQYVTDGKLDEFLPVAKVLVEETNKNDEGCLKYEMYQDLSSPLVITVIEEWASQEALDKHMKAPHFLDAIPKLGSLCDKPGEINLYKKLF